MRASKLNARAASTKDNVTQLHPRQQDAVAVTAKSQRAETARYLAQMTLELERLANTGDLELVGYFLAMARAEAEAAATEPALLETSAETQAPYRAD